ncbi:hypothetical protein KUH03_21090 [Sphingobacterium sp. E70]|nr:hypothetical protein [Sphingobacterium sp. E70]ULT28743.1 hypothetical protein KUH03_21090 [Sphingobacterium sp. E70]
MQQDAFQAQQREYKDTIPEKYCRMYLLSIVDFAGNRFRDESGDGFD